MLRAQSGIGSSGIVGALDVGTSKVSCLIFARGSAGDLRLLGSGYQRMQGMKAGVVVDAEHAERSVRAAVGQAERMAGVTLDHVVLAVTCGRLKSLNFVARAGVAERVVQRGDMARVLAAGEAYAQRSGRLLVQLAPGAWGLDSQSELTDPLGLSGSDLSLSMHAVTADEAPLRNLLSVIERCYLLSEGIVAAPYASALATTTEEERQLGVLCVDLGAGTTSLSAFSDGRFVFAASLPVGGSHLTFDIARALSTPLAEAERIKTLYGSLVRAASDEREVVSFPTADENEVSLYQTTRAHLRSIIEPRVASLYSLVSERLASAGFDDWSSGRVVLTGGTSQLVGISEWWSSQSGGNIRIGRPIHLSGMPESMSAPPFAAVVGTALAVVLPIANLGASRARAAAAQGYLGRLHRWFRESF